MKYNNNKGLFIQPAKVRRVEADKYGGRFLKYIPNIKVKGLTPKRLSWDRSAIKEQIKLEHEQMEVDCLKDVIQNIPNYRVGRCSGKSFYFISVALLLLKYKVVLEN